MRKFGYKNPVVSHSAKGSTWEDHKYIKRIDGTYYYPDNYKGGRHLPDGEKGEEKNEDESSDNDDVISKLEDLTGTKPEYLIELRELSREKGYDSPEFKELLNDISEGYEDQAERIVALLKQDESEPTLTSNDIENLALEVIRGNFGNGQVRKDLLAGNYDKIQQRVNELMKAGNYNSIKIDSVSEDTVKTGETAMKKAEQKVTQASKGVDMEKVLSVYRNRK